MELGVLQHGRRNINRHRERLFEARPVLHSVPNRIEHEPGQPADISGALRQRDEVLGWNEASTLGAPPDQSFYAIDNPAENVHLGLVIDFELSFLDGSIQVAFEFPERGLLTRLIRSVDVIRELPLHGTLQGQLGATKETRRIISVGWVDGDAKSDVHQKMVIAHLEFRLIVLRDLRRDIDDPRHGIGRKNDGESAPGQANNRRAGRKRFSKLLDVAGAEITRLIMPEGCRDSVKRVQLTQ